MVRAACRLLALSLSVAVLFAASSAAHAQTSTGPVQLFRDGSPGAISLDSSRHGGEFVVPLNKSQLLRVDQPFEEISVGNAEIADVVPMTKQQIYVLGRQLGSTNLTVLGRQGQVIAVVDLVVSFDVEGLKAKLFELMPDERIEVRPAGDAILLSGRVTSAERLGRTLAIAERYAPGKVTNLLSVGGSQQVMLAVRFAEVQRSAAKQLGLSSLVLEGGDASFQFDSGDGIDPESFATGLFSYATGNFSLDLLFDTLEEKGVVKTLAEPNLIVLSGDTAAFLAGGEFPIPVSQREDAITIEFKEFGVGLSFTPTVLDNALVNLVLETEVSAIDETVSVTTDGIQVPGLTVRRATTTVELSDGQSFAIAGLLQDDFRDAIRQFPWLGDLPVLGTLLRSTEYQSRQTELVLVITPRLVQPVAAGALTTPADNFLTPSEADLFLLGRTVGRPPASGSGSTRVLRAQHAGGIDGPHGYILQ
jgi:pilus assembly protein CpaC